MLGHRIPPNNNGGVLTTVQIIKDVMSSITEANIGTMFINARKVVPVCRTLEEMGYLQPKMPMQTDNSAAHFVVFNNFQLRFTKAMDMRFHWLWDRAAQGQLRYY